MRGAIGVHDFAENDISVLAACVGIQSHRFQQAVRTLALGLHGGTAVKTPGGQVGEGGWMRKILELSFAAQLRNGLFAVEPDVFEFVFFHGIGTRVIFVKLRKLESEKRPPADRAGACLRRKSKSSC